MTASPLRLHGRCPECLRVMPLRPDGTVLRHPGSRQRGPFRVSNPGYCDGGGKPSVPGSVEAWLAEQDAAAERRLSAAVTALEAARLAREDAAKLLGEWQTWAAKQRAKLAKAAKP